MTDVTFTVAGIPAPQGSLTRNRYGATYGDNPNTKPWRAAVAAAAALAVNGDHPYTGPCELHVTFTFPRPKSHYRTGANAHLLRSSAPQKHTTKPDTDKLLRAIGDALTGIVVRDDSQFHLIHALKLYGQPAAHITIRSA